MSESHGSRGLWATIGIAALAGTTFGGAPDLLPGQSATVADRYVGPFAPGSIARPDDLSNVISREAFQTLDEVHQRMLDTLSKQAANTVISPCFVPGSDDALVAAFEATFDRLNPDRYNQTLRWSGSIALGSAGAFGEPITLTYSFPPDGTAVPDGVGEGAGVSNLFAYLDGIYGSPIVWQPIYDQFFDRWEELTGINYVYEPNDDGAELFNNPGAAGVRGDLRMAGKFIDGNPAGGSILAYNFFPNNGDMVIDTGDTFYTNTSGSSLRLRNVLAHEHGHGMGQLHVCPVQQTKLMEPFVSTAYDGPRHDDIRNAHRFYGDVNEPDNDAGSATDLGALAIPSSVTVGPTAGAAIANGSVISIDANGEQDYFRFSVSGPAQVSVTLTPIGLTYLDDVQNCTGSGNCCSTTSTDSLAQANLGVEVLATNGATVLGSASSQPTGVVESLSNVFLTAAGEYYVRVFETDSPVESQLYHAAVSVAAPPFIPVTMSFPSGLPTELASGLATDFDVEINAGDETLTPGSALVSYRYDGGSFVDVPLVSQGGDLYTATLPAAQCADQPEFHVSVVGSLSGLVRSPSSGEYTAIVGTAVPVADFDFEVGTGWTVASDVALTAGAWDLGIPVDGGRGDPATDADGSGACYLTQNNLGPLNDGNSDVDGGETRLRSPIFDLTGIVDPVISYSRWFSNDLGDNPQTNTMTIEMSDDAGTNWVVVEVVGPTTGSANPEVSGGWIDKSFNVEDFVGLSNQFQVRFRVSDATGAIVEAGVDAFSITGRSCVDAPACPGDVNGDGQTNIADFNIMAGNFGDGPGSLPSEGDLSGDGFVNISDFNIMAGNFGCGVN
jgi:hypothetical protein